MRLLMLGYAGICSTVAAVGQVRPAALEKAQQQREALHTGVVNLSREYPGEGGPPMLCTAQFGEQGDVLTYRGDESGQFYYADGTVDAHNARAVLKANNQAWVYYNDGLQVDLYEADARQEAVYNMRSLGFSPYNGFGDLHDVLWRDASKQPAGRTYSESIEDGLHVVRAAAEYGTITWYLDPQRGWNPVRVTFEQAGRVTREARSTLRQYDGVWYPATVAFFVGGVAEPKEVLTLTAASFNRPDQPRVLKPADIGVEAGMLVSVTKVGDKHEALAFDGEKAVTQDEFNKRIWAGEIKRGPANLRAIAELEADAARSELEGASATGNTPADPTSVRRGRESAWEAYTRQFIARYHLDDGQSQKAWSTLRECQEEANQYLLRHRAEFEQLQQKLEKVANADTPKEEDLRARSQQADKLRAPLNEIFERQLKPRLKKLPTRAQRVAAGAEQPATQPDNSAEE
jgi:hypothetical protein